MPDVERKCLSTEMFCIVTEPVQLAMRIVIAVKMIDFMKDCRAMSSDAYQTQNIEYFYDQVIEFLA